MRQPRVNGTYFRPFFGARGTRRMLFTECILPMNYGPCLQDARRAVNKVCWRKFLRRAAPMTFQTRALPCIHGR
jgi:hypothetical protein